MTYLLRWMLVAVVVWLVFRWLRRRPRPKPDHSATVPLVRCARCGVHLPESEAVSQGTRHYCSIAHRDEEAR
jgi:uncharacterized protein